MSLPSRDTSRVRLCWYYCEEIRDQFPGLRTFWKGTGQTSRQQHDSGIFTTIYHHGFLSLRKEEPLPEMSPQTPVSGYSWPRRTQVADKVVSPSCLRSSMSSCPFSWCPLCHSFCPSVVFESCNVSRPSTYSLVDNVYDIIYTCLMSYPGITFVVA